MSQQNEGTPTSRFGRKLVAPEKFDHINHQEEQAGSAAGDILPKTQTPKMPAVHHTRTRSGSKGKAAKSERTEPTAAVAQVKSSDDRFNFSPKTFWIMGRKAIVAADDGSDDWDEFAGNPAHYDSLTQFHRTIARVFVTRAQRAFKHGKSWTAFAHEETTMDSQRKARQDASRLSDRRRAQIVLEEALDNGLRLAIFDALSPRLCSEIWEEPYHGPIGPKDQRQDSMADGMADAIANVPAAPVVVKEGGNVGNIGVSGRLGMTAVDELASGPLDMDTSDDE